MFISYVIMRKLFIRMTKIDESQFLYENVCKEVKS